MNFLGRKYAYPARIVSVRNETSAVSLSGLSQTTRIGHQWWEVDITLEPKSWLFDDDTGDIVAHQARHGAHLSFFVPMPQVVVPEAFPNKTSYRIGADAAAGSDTVNLVGDITLPAGYFISLVNSNEHFQHEKVYVVKENVTLTSAGVDVKIEPDLVVDWSRYSSPIWTTWKPNPNLKCVYRQGTDTSFSLATSQIVTARLLLAEAF